MRSAIAPETIVAEVAANTVWKIRKVKFQSLPDGSVPARPKSDVPIQPPLLAPNIRPKPMTKNATLPTEKSMRFFMRIFTAFFAREKPVSTMANPACMKNTRNAAIHVQTMFKFVCNVLAISAISGPEGFSCPNALPAVSINNIITARTMTVLRFRIGFILSSDFVIPATTGIQ